MRGGGGAYNGSTPFPRGFNVKEGGERERDDKREREIEREGFILFHSFPIKGLNSYKRGRYIVVQGPLAIDTNQSLTPIYSHSQL